MGIYMKKLLISLSMAGALVLASCGDAAVQQSDVESGASYSDFIEMAEQGDATRTVESAMAVLDGAAVVVIVASTLEDRVDVFVYPEDSCGAVRIVDQELP